MIYFRHRCERDFTGLSADSVFTGAADLSSTRHKTEPHFIVLSRAPCLQPLRLFVNNLWDIWSALCDLLTYVKPPPCFPFNKWIRWLRFKLRDLSFHAAILVTDQTIVCLTITGRCLCRLLRHVLQWPRSLLHMCWLTALNSSTNVLCLLVVSRETDPGVSMLLNSTDAET